MKNLAIALCLLALMAGMLGAGTLRAACPTDRPAQVMTADGGTWLLEGIDWDEWLMLEGIDWDEWLEGIFGPPTDVT